MCIVENLVIQKVEKGTKESAILSFILTNRNEVVQGAEVVAILRKSDHVMLAFTIMQARITKQSQISMLDFKRDYFNKLRERIGRIPWTEILEGNTVFVWETLNIEIIKDQTKTIPQIKKSKRHLMRTVWLHKELSDKLGDKNDKYKNGKRGL